MLTDPDGPFFQVRLDRLDALRVIRDLVCEVNVVFWILDDHPAHRLVATADCAEAKFSPGWQQHGPLDAHRLLVPEQPFIVAAAVVGVLVQIDDFLLILPAERLAGQGGSGDRGACGG